MLCYLWRSGWPQMLVTKSYHCLILIVTKIWRNILKWSYFIVSLNFDVIFTNNKQLIIVIGNVFVTPWLLYVSIKIIHSYSNSYLILAYCHYALMKVICSLLFQFSFEQALKQLHLNIHYLASLFTLTASCHIYTAHGIIPWIN